ncbi:unnamed protein product [Prunus armeniaca]
MAWHERHEVWEPFCLNAESMWSGSSWEAIVLLMVFLLGGIDENNDLIPNIVAYLCTRFFCSRNSKWTWVAAKNE